MTHLTLDMVRSTFDEILAEKGPDYVYVHEAAGGDDEDGETEECTYAYSDGSPACAVGHIIAKLDPELFQQMRLAEKQVGPFGILQLGGTYSIPRGDAEKDAANWMAILQDQQDKNKPWGEAKREADDRVARVD